MKAVSIDKFGEINSVQFKDYEIPHPNANELLLKVFYAGVNPVDWKICKGHLKELMPHKFPITLGWDMSGTIIGMGENIKDFNLGDEVYAYCRKDVVHDGSFSEYICLNTANVALKPKTISFSQAAAIPLVALTAWQSLFGFAGLQKDQKVLIHAGAGGVGSLAIQFAKNIGAYVISTASRKNHEYVTKLGADWVIDYNEEDFELAIKKRFSDKLDLIYDCVGGNALLKSYSLVKEKGCIVSIVEAPDETLIPDKTIKSGFVFVSPNSQQLKEIGYLIDSGKLILPEVHVRPFKKVKEALEESQKGHVRGKIVLQIVLQINQNKLTDEVKKKIFNGFAQQAIESTGINGLSEDPISFEIFDGTEFVGAIVVQAFWEQLHIKYLFVEKNYRGQGIARVLMNHALEFGIKRGYHFAFVETMSFQAPEFYQKMGFTTEFSRSGYAKNTIFHYLKKSLDGSETRN